MALELLRDVEKMKHVVNKSHMRATEYIELKDMLYKAENKVRDIHCITSREDK